MKINKTVCDGCGIEKRPAVGRGISPDKDWLKFGMDKSGPCLDLCPGCAKRLTQSIMDELEAIQKESRGDIGGPV